MMFGVDVKAFLFERVEKRIQEYEKEPRIKTRYKTPLIGYVSAENPFFHEFYERKASLHPKQVFRPGNTVIVYFVPFSDEITHSNMGGDVVSAAWDRAMGESIMLTAHINGTLREAIDELGHDTSGTNLPKDWIEEICGPAWSHKHAAFAAGLGNFGTAGSFHTREGFAGCFGSVITTLTVDDTKEWSQEELFEKSKTCDAIEKAVLFASPEKIPLCPAGAITENGVDRFACREFCKKQDQPAPIADVCGKCFF